MTKIEEIDTGATKVGPYSHGIKVGEFIFTSGQVADQNVQGIANQTRGALEKIKKIL